MLLDFLSAKERAPAECLVKVNGQEITALYPFLLEITVQCGRAEAATASLTFETRRDELGRWTVQDAELLTPWAPVEIHAAFGHRTEEVMRGYIREVKLDTPQDAGATQVRVECQDDSIRLDREHHRKTWGSSTLPSSDRLLLMEILSGYGLLPHPKNEGGQDRLVGIAQDDTDIKFLKSRAEFNGYELIFREGLVYFGPMRLDADPADTLLIYAGADTNCLSLTAHVNGHQADAVAYNSPAESGNGVSPNIEDHTLTVLGLQMANSRAAGVDLFFWQLSAEVSAHDHCLQDLAQHKANKLDIILVHTDDDLDRTFYSHVLQADLLVVMDGLGDWLSGTY
ncbi:hypothetical protein [Ideonella sp. B508-1]|uniref:hypothetical protein n=1 Tax=Ideonella sp. B508-1 TaxID=137716 RepID=UPI000349608A|nr:hypothetical protein [Ideonella sp. B508-1]